MRRAAGRRLTWSLSLGLIAAGSLAAHLLAYRIVVPDATVRKHLLEESGHGYLDPAPLGSLCVTLVVVGFLARALGGRAAAPRASARLFAVLPLVTFGFQEHLERLIHTGTFPYAAAVQPTFLVGLLLQVPFGLVAFAVARVLLRGADALAAALAGPARRPAAVAPLLPVPAGAIAAPSRLHALARAPRGPPFPASR
ncbi:MAG TPA: hypothetical protein VHF23_10570 [Gaiellaceae bacterium]|nr:hypothetical protein [Gaiellaceae bacterium]